jgi:hypothetical protein
MADDKKFPESIAHEIKATERLLNKRFPGCGLLLLIVSPAGDNVLLSSNVDPISGHMVLTKMADYLGASSDAAGALLRWTPDTKTH